MTSNFYDLTALDDSSSGSSTGNEAMPVKKRYYLGDNDVIKISKDKVCLSISGDPVPLQRHKMNGKQPYSPSSKDATKFKKILRKMIKNQGMGPLMPGFKSSDALKVTIVFHMRRPKRHF